MKTNFLFRARAGMSRASVDLRFFQIKARAIGGGLSEHQCGAARCVRFLVVMPFDHLNIIAFGVQFFRGYDVNVVAAVSNVGENPKVEDLIGSIKIMLDAFEKGSEEGGIDRLFLLHNHFESTMSQKPKVNTLIPVEAPDAEELPEHWDYLYEPEATELLTSVLQRYIESQVYRGAVENVACEMAAKMVAMKSATDNAGKLIDGLQLDYNKARQAAITQEISEIVGGAAAVSE